LVLSAEPMPWSKWMLATEQTPSHTMGNLRGWKKPAFTKDKCCLQKSETYCANQIFQLKWMFVQIYPAGCFPEGNVIESFITLLVAKSFIKPKASEFVYLIYPDHFLLH
jgi:hypothetical protein